MPVDIVLSNAKILIEGDLIEAGIAIENGKIVRIAKDSNLPEGSTKINLKGNIIVPGLIDSHVHLRDQRLAYKENFSGYFICSSSISARATSTRNPLVAIPTV